LWYSVHLESAAGNPAKLDFIPPGFGPSDVTYHNVLTEWHATDPKASTFSGTRRELLRYAHVVQFSSHPLGAVEFNPTARPGSPDYGLLYTSGSDLGFSNGGGPNASNPSATQRLDSLITAILRIDPRSPRETGGPKGLGDYTIPADNKFQADGDPKTLGDIYAYGFRNAHRLSWDLTDGTMYVGDIGMNQIEEVNIVRNGGNYGWMKREGYFENGMIRPGGALNQLYELPADVLKGRGRDEFTYPVAIYDHDEGVAITVVFPYRGLRNVGIVDRDFVAPRERVQRVPAPHRPVAQHEDLHSTLTSSGVAANGNDSNHRKITSRVTASVRRTASSLVPLSVAYVIQINRNGSTTSPGSTIVLTGFRRRVVPRARRSL